MPRRTRSQRKTLPPLHTANLEHASGGVVGDGAITYALDGGGGTSGGWGDFGGGFGDLGLGDLGGGWGDFGGGFGDLGFNDPGVVDWGAGGNYVGDLSGNPAPDVDGMIDAMSPEVEWGEGPTEADVDTTGVVPNELTPQERFDLNVDLLQNYQDTASPDQLWQTSLSNCETIATINALERTPEGRAFLASIVQPQGDGSFSVRLVGADGQPQMVTVTPGLDGSVAGGGNQNMQVVATAITIAAGQMPTIADVNYPRDNGLLPGEAMTRLGLENVTNSNTMGPVVTEHVPGQTVALGGMYPHGSEGHAYTVVGTLTDPNTGAPAVVLQNPFGFDHPAPVQGSALTSPPNDASIGTIPTVADPGNLP